jgi:hypothetical protein
MMKQFALYTHQCDEHDFVSLIIYLKSLSVKYLYYTKLTELCLPLQLKIMQYQ